MIIAVIISIIVLLTRFGITQPTSSKWPPRPLTREGHPALYKYDDPNIIILDSDNFEPMINGPERDYILMIQFYLDWCEGCRKVVQAYSDLARNISAWEGIIRVAAINCAEERNIAICREYGWIAYPAFKLFPPTTLINHNSSESNAQLIDSSYVGRKVHRFIQIILEYIDSFAINGSTSPLSWPNFDPVKVNSKSDLDSVFNQLSKRNSSLLLIIDRDTRDLTRMVLMDMSVYQANLVIRRLQVSPEFDEELRRNSTDIPILLHMATKKNGKSSLKIVSSREIGGSTREAITKYIEVHFAQAIRNKRMDSIYFGDLYKGLRHSLYNEVTLHKNLNSTQIAVLSAYISVIHKYFPFDNENPRRFFKRMDQWIKSRKNGKPLNTVDFLATMRVGSEGFIPFVDNYIHCKSGYPCSLWLIFHTLTVSEFTKMSKPVVEQSYDTNSSTVITIAINETDYWDNDDDDLELSSGNHHSVLYAMRDYVKYFYSCAECSSHFSKLSNDLESKLVQPNSSVLWLWQAHNQINDRLTHEAPDHPKQQFPSRTMCPRCYTPADNWASNEVLNFLINHYKKNRLVNLRNFSQQLRSGELVFLLIVVTIINFCSN